MSPATRGAQKFCPNCGAKVTKTQKFCRECGEGLLASDADATEELSAKTPSAPMREASAARTQKLPPPPPPGVAPPPPPPPPPPPGPGLSTTFAWPAWIGVGACGVLVIATGLPWFGGFLSADSFDIPFAALFSNTAAGGFPIGVVFVLAAATGLAMALIKPDERTLSITYLSVGAASCFFMLWYMIRILSQAQGAPIFDALSVGAWFALLSSIAILVAGVMMRQGVSRATA